jgi:activator of 2-hydroxyglutaryl-CoA dehydratase
MSRFAIGVDLGGTRIRAALIDRNGAILQRAETPTAADAGPKVVIDQLHHIAASVVASVARDDLIGVVICAPGPLPELNDIEVVWHDLKAHNLAHSTFTDAADLDRAIHQAVQALNNERSRNPLVNRRISA